MFIKIKNIYDNCDDNIEVLHVVDFSFELWNSEEKKYLLCVRLTDGQLAEYFVNFYSQSVSIS